MSDVAAPAASGRHVLRLAALSMAMLLPSLGTSIANVALPALEEAFGASFPQVQWIVLGYLLAATASIVAAGRLGDAFGRRLTLLGGMALFTAASALGLAAPTLWSLVALRFIQGAAAAAMIALAVALVGDVIPRQRAGAAMGLLGTVSAVGTALGPIAGGLLVSWFGWRGVFGMMAAAGVAGLVTSGLALPAAKGFKVDETFDWMGAILLAVALGAFALSTTIGLASSLQLAAALAVAAALALAAFVALEARARAPLVRLSLLGQSHLGVSLLAMAAVSAIVMATLVAGPFFLTSTLHLGTGTTGLVMSVGPLVAALAGAPAGRMVDRMGSRPMSMAGLAGVTLGSVLMSGLPAMLGVPGYLIALSTLTAGYAVFQAANTTAIMAGVAADQRGVVSGLAGLSRNLGLIAGASALGAIFAGATEAGLGPLPPGGNTGLAVTFAVSAALAALSAVLIARGR